MHERNKNKEGSSKRKRAQSTSDHHPVNKKARPTSDKSQKNAKSGSAQGQFKKRKKKIRARRRRTTDIRHKLRDYLEKALTDSTSLPPIGHLFRDLDHRGTPRASLVEVLRTLQLSNKVKNVHFLSQYHWLSITNITLLFAIEEDEPGKGLYVKYRPMYEKEAASIYVDNLPDGCNEQRLARIAAKYGNTAEIKVIRKPPRMVRRKKFPNPPPNAHKIRPCFGQPIERRKIIVTKEFIDVGSRPRPYGFIRFTSKEAAEAMIKDFKYNDMSDRYEDVDPETVPRSNGFRNLYLQRLARELRFLQYRRKLRTKYQFYRLAFLRDRFRTLIRLEQKCRRRRRLAGAGFRPRRMTWYGGIQTYRRYPRMIRRPRVVVIQPLMSLSLFTAKPGSSRNRLSASGSDKRKLNNREQRLERRKLEALKINGHDHNIKKEVVKVEEKKIKKKKKRKRKKKSRKDKAYIQGDSVADYFEETQVFSLARHNELKTEYKELVKQGKERARIAAQQEEQEQLEQNQRQEQEQQ